MALRLTHVRLRTRILAWSFVPSAVILFAVAVVAFFAYSRVTEQQAVQRNQELARLSATNLAAEISQFSLDLGSLTGSPTSPGGGLVGSKAALAAAANKLSIFDAGTIILDARGTLAASWPERPGDIGEDWASRPYFVQLLRSPRPAYSDITGDGSAAPRSSRSPCRSPGRRASSTVSSPACSSWGRPRSARCTVTSPSFA